VDRQHGSLLDDGGGLITEWGIQPSGNLWQRERLPMRSQKGRSHLRIRGHGLALTQDRRRKIAPPT